MLLKIPRKSLWLLTGHAESNSQGPGKTTAGPWEVLSRGPSSCPAAEGHCGLQILTRQRNVREAWCYVAFAWAAVSGYAGKPLWMFLGCVGEINIYTPCSPQCGGPLPSAEV